MSSDRASVHSVRRAGVSDAAAIERLAPGLSPSAASGDRATFVIDGEAGPLAAIGLLRADGHLHIERITVGPNARPRELARTLVAFAERTARSMGIREVRLRPGSVPDDLATALGYRGGVKTMRINALTRALDHLEEVGVPLWRDGNAALDQTLYHRGIWAALALLIGLGSVTLAVFGSGDVTLFHVVAPALLCALSSAFAVWQVLLIAVAARRSRRGPLALGTVAAATVSIMAIAALIQGRAVPALIELWNIYAGDEELGRLAVSVSPGGTTLWIEGAYGVGSADVVRRALEQHPSIRGVVLAGPGGRIGPAFEINRMIRERRLATRVETACASACTIAFLGGVERSVSPSARLGFHQGSFPGMSSNDMFESNRDMKRFLIASGVTPEFAQRVIDTPADGVWVPSPQELLAGGVVQRVSR